MRDGIDRPLSQKLTAARVQPTYEAICPRVSPALISRDIALIFVMVTNGNPESILSQPRVTEVLGNMLYPSERPSENAMSQSMQRLFDIVKTQAKMKDAGLNNSDLARALGYERQAVGHWMRGRGEPNVQQMKTMAKELGCHWLELATEETIVVFKEEERERVERMRQLSQSELAELDAFLAFKAAAKG